MPTRARSLELWHRTEKSLGGGVSTGLRRRMPPHPLFIERGAGARIWDVDGLEYLDYVLAWGPLILGHCHPKVVSAMSAQLNRGVTFGSGHEWEYRAAEAVCSAMPGVERVLWSNTGTEAVQSALRLARAATGRRRVVKFQGHYHGWMDSVLVAYRQAAAGHVAQPESQGQNAAALDDVIVLPWNDFDAFDAVMSQHAYEIAAVLAEPVLCNSGVIAPAGGFLELLRSRTQRDGSVLIFDEVITGFRIAYGGAAERYGVIPDLRTLGKALGAGAPVAAIAGRAELIDRVTTGVTHAGTYNGNPLVLAATAAALETLGDKGTYEALEANGQALASGLRDALGRSGFAFAVNQVGPVVQCALGVGQLQTYQDFAAADWGLWDRILVELLDEGIFALPGGRWYLSTAHSAADLDRTITGFAAALGRVPA